MSVRVRNLAALKAREEETRLQQDLEQRTKRLRSNPAVYQQFKVVPEAVAWLSLFDSMLVDILHQWSVDIDVVGRRNRSALPQVLVVQ